SFIEPSPKTKRARAPRKIVPSVHVEPSVLDRFLRSNHAARELIRQAGNYDVNRIRFKNPLLQVLRFTVGTGLEIGSRHERRHLLQAERAKRASGFPGPCFRWGSFRCAVTMEHFGEKLSFLGGSAVHFPDPLQPPASNLRAGCEEDLEGGHEIDV